MIEKVKAAGGLAYAEEKMEEFRQKALTLLLEFPQDPIEMHLNKCELRHLAQAISSFS